MSEHHPGSRVQDSPTSREPVVCIVDDDEAMRDALRTLIRSVGIGTREYASAEQFLEDHDNDQPGCLILDVRMPGMSGLDLQDALVVRNINLPVIVITGHADIPMAVRAMRAGAVDFLEKPFREQDLLQRIKQAIEQDAAARRERARKEEIAARFDALTPRERQVLDLVVAGKHNKAIAAQLNVSHKTIEFHRARIMAKIQVSSIPQLVRLAVAGGLRDREKPGGTAGRPRPERS
jgi:two-component system response regulator FixJ